MEREVKEKHSGEERERREHLKWSGETSREQREIEGLRQSREIKETQV